MNGKVEHITIPHLGRVEGHGGIDIKISNGVVEEVNMDIFEGSRYYEALLRGKHFLEVQGIITRVCAICSSSHTVAALTAIENALGVKRSERVHNIRGLLLLGSTIESHALHVFALALPDFLGFDSVISMASKYPGEVTFALKLKQLGNRIQELIGGRPVHPINTLVGGFGKLPKHEDLKKIKEELSGALDPLMKFVELAATIPIPGWSANKTVYAAIKPYENELRFRGDMIVTSEGKTVDVNNYKEIAREFTVEHSHAKHSALASGDTFMVGSQARLKLWGGFLKGKTKIAFDKLFPHGVEDNILLNNWAQLVELVHCVERGIELCDILTSTPEQASEMVEYETRAGKGVGAIEAPRGMLFHEYELDEKGRVVSANVITPTAQNLANVERDLKKAATELLKTNAEEKELKLGLEMIARAYDPCISCSVHIIRDDR